VVPYHRPGHRGVVRSFADAAAAETPISAADLAWLLTEYYSSSIPEWLRALKSFPSAFPTSLPLLLASVPDAAACRPSWLKLSLANSNVKRSVSSWTSSTKPSDQFLKLHFVARGGRGRSADSRF
jgi:hypothetical protein